MKKTLKEAAAALYRYWMRFAHLLGWVNTRIILTLFYGILFVPLGLILKLLRKDLLDQSFHDQESYWTKRELVLDRERYLKPY